MTLTAKDFYLLRLHTSHQGDSAGADLFVSVEGEGTPKAYANRGASIDLGPERTVYEMSTTLEPNVGDDGLPGSGLSYTWSVLSGDATLSNPSLENPELSFGTAEAATLRLVVDDGEVETYSEVTLTGTTETAPPFVETTSGISNPYARGANDDPDRDGRTNLEEHAVGTDPSVAGGSAVVDVRDGAEELNVDVCLRLPANLPGDVRYELQRRSSLLEPWTTVATATAAEPWTGMQPGEVKPDGADYFMHIFDQTEGERSFYRVRFSLITP